MKLMILCLTLLTSTASFAANLWPNGVVVYQFDSNLQNWQKQLFLQACQEWGAQANITCVARTNQRSYVDVYHGDGDRAYIGYKGGAQQFSIKIWEKWNVLHEFGHTLGFYHEHQRTDRDRYVSIILDNAYAGEDIDRQFNIMPGFRQNTPYDFQSVMHYGPRALSYNGLVTIAPKSGDYNFGKAQYLSRYDIQDAIDLYGY